MGTAGTLAPSAARSFTRTSLAASWAPTAVMKLALIESGSIAPHAELSLPLCREDPHSRI